jgi:hypothetical protein
VRLADIPRPHAAAEAKRGGVAAPNDLVAIGERDRGDDRAEDLLLGDPRVVAHVCVDWRNKVSLGKRSLDQLLAADDGRGALLARDVEVPVTRSSCCSKTSRPM